jgi:VanZ family protein
MKPKIKYYGPAILWALFILIICSVPMGGVGESHLFFPGFDKLVHCGLFAVLAIFYCSASIKRLNTRTILFKVAIKNALILISFGALIEVLQKYFFTWRSGNWDDLFADTVGAGIGIFGVLITINAINRNEN